VVLALGGLGYLGKSHGCAGAHDTDAVKQSQQRDMPRKASEEQRTHEQAHTQITKQASTKKVVTNNAEPEPAITIVTIVPAEPANKTSSIIPVAQPAVTTSQSATAQPSAIVVSETPVSAGSKISPVPTPTQKSHAKEAAELHADRKYKHALEQWNLAIDETAGSHKLHTNRANTLLSLEKPEDALQDAIKSIELQPSAGAYLVQGQAYFELEQLDASYEALQRVKEDPHATQQQIRQANIELERVKPKIAERDQKAAEIERVRVIKAKLAEKARIAEGKRLQQESKDAQLAAIRAVAPDALMPEAATATLPGAGRSYATALLDHRKTPPLEIA